MVERSLDGHTCVKTTLASSSENRSETHGFELMRNSAKVIVIGQCAETGGILLSLDKVTYFCLPQIHTDICFTKFINLWAVTKQRAMIYIVNNSMITKDFRRWTSSPT